MIEFFLLFLWILQLLTRNVTAFKALDSYKLDSGEFPFQPNGETDVTKILTRFYVKEDATCEKFYYKGSGGNSNNFGTQHECYDHLKDLSNWETLEGCKEGYLAPGPCTKEAVTKYGYVASSATCTNFDYKGCGGNNNRFGSLTDCQRACEVEGNKAPNLYDCNLSPKYPISDDVKVAIVKSQDEKQTKCHYAIVDQTETRGIFPSFSKCLTTCFNGSLIEACKKDVPDQDTATNGSPVVKFYYHQTKKACFTFLTKAKSTGFDPNKNYFNTEEECMSYCPVEDDEIEKMTYHVSKDICSLSSEPTASGSLSDLTKWYYKTTGSSPGCTSMNHGGIGDTNGLFDTEGECKALCENSS